MKLLKSTVEIDTRIVPIITIERELGTGNVVIRAVDVSGLPPGWQSNIVGTFSRSDLHDKLQSEIWNKVLASACLIYGLRSRRIGHKDDRHLPNCTNSDLHELIDLIGQHA